MRWDPVLDGANAIATDSDLVVDEAADEEVERLQKRKKQQQEGPDRP
jgi:hypothetical protein